MNLHLGGAQKREGLRQESRGDRETRRNIRVIIIVVVVVDLLLTAVMAFVKTHMSMGVVDGETSRVHGGF